MSGKYIKCGELEGVSIFESEEMEKAWAILLADKERTFSVVQISPAARISIGERFGMACGEDGIGRFVTVLRRSGADAVVDTAICEDVLASQYAKKLLAKSMNEKSAPIVASRCPAWVNYAQEKYPELETSILPTATSISGALLKEYYKEKTGKTVRVISIEPCSAKKECFGVDVVLTAEEFSDMLVEVEDVGVNLRLLKKEALDAPFGGASGGGYISDVSGGAAEAVARCLSEDKAVEAFQKFSYSGLYGEKEVREAKLNVDGREWKFAVVCGVKAADALIKAVFNGEAEYDFIEVTACAGGCVGGEGLLAEKDGVDEDMARRLRAQGLKTLDVKRSARSADRNPAIGSVEKAWAAWCKKKAVGMLEEETDVEPVVLDYDDEIAVTETEESIVCVEEVVEEIAPSGETTEKIEEVEENLEVVEESASVEEVVEEIAPVVEIVEAVEVAEETSEETAEEPTEAIANEEKTKKDPYHTRMSNRDRRKMKRMKKGK